jgi:epoxyqueuosine reductase
MKITNDIIFQKAKEIGFDLVGFSKAGELNAEILNLENWLSRDFHAGMDYMGRNVLIRKDVSQILPTAKSVISLAKNYYTDTKYSGKNDFGKVSRYAWGVDYHLIIWDMLYLLENELKKIDPEIESKSYVDTGPVMEKAWAVKSGIGWLGKHTNLINKEYGSWIFLATIITNYELEYSNPILDFCGTCTDCIDACPTKAIVNEYVVDANKCISYLTIENKGQILSDFKNNFENWIFGCDICQDVCPWNSKFSKVTKQKEFFPINGNEEIKLSEVMNMREEEFKNRFEKSPVKRAKLKGLKRNAEFLINEMNIEKNTKFPE